jgi:hypothetical protein
MRKTPLRPAFVLVLVALTGSPLAVSAALALRPGADRAPARTASFTEAWASQSAQAKQPSNEWMAWKLGREYAFASAWTLMKESAQSQKSLGLARTIAKALGLSEPPPPAADYQKHIVALAKELDAKYNEKTRYHFLVGIRVTDAWFGASIGADVKKQVTELASFLERSGITPSVWNTQLTAIQAKATDADLRKLAQALDEHLKR